MLIEGPVMKVVEFEFLWFLKKFEFKLFFGFS